MKRFVAWDDPKKLARATLAAVKRAGRRPPLEGFRDLVRRGLIDENGRVVMSDAEKKRVLSRVALWPQRSRTDERTQPAQETRAAAPRSFKRLPLEVWEDLIRRGVIDRQGRVTRLIGGTAEPEPEALRLRGRHSRTRARVARPAAGVRGIARPARRGR